MMESKIRVHDEDGKDYNAKAMIHRNTGKIGQHNGYTGMENKKTSRRWDRTSSRNSKTRRLWTTTTVLRLQEALNECSSKTLMSLVLSSGRKDKVDEELRSMR